MKPADCCTRVRGRFIAEDMVRKPDTQLLQTSAITVEIDRTEKPALIANWLTSSPFNRPAKTCFAT